MNFTPTKVVRSPLEWRKHKNFKGFNCIGKIPMIPIGEKECFPTIPLKSLMGPF